MIHCRKPRTWGRNIENARLFENLYFGTGTMMWIDVSRDYITLNSGTSVLDRDYITWRLKFHNFSMESYWTVVKLRTLNSERHKVSIKDHELVRMGSFPSVLSPFSHVLLLEVHKQWNRGPRILDRQPQVRPFEFFILRFQSFQASGTFYSL